MWCLAGEWVFCTLGMGFVWGLLTAGSMGTSLPCVSNSGLMINTYRWALIVGRWRVFWNAVMRVP